MAMSPLPTSSTSAVTAAYNGGVTAADKQHQNYRCQTTAVCRYCTNGDNNSSVTAAEYRSDTAAKRSGGTAADKW